MCGKSDVPSVETPSARPRLLSDKSSESVDRLLLERFKKLSRFPEAFSSVQYLGTQTLSPPTNFGGLQNKLEQLLDNNATRSPRTSVVIYKALQVDLRAVTCSFVELIRWRLPPPPSLLLPLQALSERFNGEITGELAPNSCFFPDEYFTCSSLCLSCGRVPLTVCVLRVDWEPLLTLRNVSLPGLAAGTA